MVIWVINYWHQNINNVILILTICKIDDVDYQYIEELDLISYP